MWSKKEQQKKTVTLQKLGKPTQLGEKFANILNPMLGSQCQKLDRHLDYNVILKTVKQSVLSSEVTNQCTTAVMTVCQSL